MIDLQGTPVLVTGGNGFVGSYLAAGARVSALVRQPGDHPGLDYPNITQVAGDFTKPASRHRRRCSRPGGR
jgi:uncharacterized protein YbjT (DUF2867 family)